MFSFWLCFLYPLFSGFYGYLRCFQLLLHLGQVGLALLLGGFQSRYLFTTLLLFEVQHRQRF